MKACMPGLRGPPSVESRQGLFTGQSEEEELERRLGVEDFRRELPLTWVEPLLAASAADWTSSGSQVTTYEEEGRKDDSWACVCNEGR